MNSTVVGVQVGPFFFDQSERRKVAGNKNGVVAVDVFEDDVVAILQTVRSFATKLSHKIL